MWFTAEILHVIIEYYMHYITFQNVKNVQFQNKSDFQGFIRNCGPLSGAPYFLG